MDDELSARTEKLREAFQLGPDTELLSSDTAAPELPSELIARLARFHIEWHIIPADTVVPFDDQYVARFYRMAPREFAHPRDHAPSYREVLAKGHAKHQGRIVGVETTQKPRYLPGNRQFYGTPYGFDASADPFAYYMGRAGLTNATRYAHNYISLREFVRVVNEDWRARRLSPRARTRMSTNLISACALARGLVEHDCERRRDVKAFDGRAHRDAYARSCRGRLIISKSARLCAQDDRARACPVYVRVLVGCAQVCGDCADAVSLAPRKRIFKTSVQPERQPKSRSHC